MSLSLQGHIVLSTYLDRADEVVQHVITPARGRGRNRDVSVRDDNRVDRVLPRAEVCDS